GDGGERPVRSALLLGDAAAPGPAESPPVVRHPPWALRLAPGAAGWLQVAAEGGGLSYQWSRDGRPVVGATHPALEVRAEGSGVGARYAVTVANPLGRVVAPEVEVAPASDPAGELVNLSVRATAGAAEDQLVAGLAVRDAPVHLLARAVGPGLEPFGVAGVLADPALELRSVAGRLLAANEDWSITLADSAAGAGAFPLRPGSRDAGLLATADPGTFLLACPLPAGARPGEVLLEVYGLAGSTGVLANLSTRSRLGPQGVLTAGFVVRGGAAATILVRGIGPSLRVFGVAEAMGAPRLVLSGGDGVLAVNEAWAAAPNAAAVRMAAARMGAFPVSSVAADAALLVSLSPGPYTASLLPAGGAFGVGLIEVYEVR
ncbi:MAG: hypothetical protein ACO3G4_04220, partial [Opitutaceae bacterium]